jgi:hypothetical protein
MQLKSEAPDALISFMQDIGIPSNLHSDDESGPTYPQ